MQFKKKPAEVDTLTPLRGLLAKIDALRSELDAYLGQYCRLVAPPGVQASNLRMMYDGRSQCLCYNTKIALDERIAAIELERRQMKEEATS
jgi:hypothetical protein